jgi:U3 small nucleolar RNA-associated protein 22
VEVLARALGDRITSIRAFTSGNGNIRESVSTLDETDEHVATNIIADSDQCHVMPIRGSTSHILGYSARTGDRSPMSPALQLSDDMNESCLVVGLRIDPNNSRRIVDRGPPAEDVLGSNAFVSLWGEQHAQLRRFQDGAIVRAVVWNDTPSLTESVQFSGMDRSMGGIVERIVQHIVKLHFIDGKLVKAKKNVTFQLRNMISLIDGASSPQSSPFSDSLALHKNIMTAFDSLADFLRQNSRTATEHALGKKASNLGLPLAIDTVEPLSPCLRYSELFPPVPHPLLGGVSADVLGSDKRKVSGVNVGLPILIQIRFEGSSKWPTSLNAMGAAKCAMLLQLADGIEKMKQERGNVAEYDLNSFDGPIDVTPTYLDVGYRGYSWRIIVRADQELRMLRTLRNPTSEANALRLVSALDRKSIWNISTIVVFSFLICVNCP